MYSYSCAGSPLGLLVAALWYCSTGERFFYFANQESVCYNACEKVSLDAGGLPFHSRKGEKYFFPFRLKGGGGAMQVTYAELFQFCLVLLGVATLVVTCVNKKK